jgi:hypothetical protein
MSKTPPIDETRLEVHISNNPPSKLKTYGFAIAIIVGICGLAVGGIGLAGYFHVGALSNLTQIQTMIMMSAGGCGGVTLLVLGILAVKNRKHGSNHEYLKEEQETQSQKIESPEDGLIGLESGSTDTVLAMDGMGPHEIDDEIYTHTPPKLSYGLKEWEGLGVHVLDNLTEPTIPWDDYDSFFNEPFRNNYVLFYIPKRVKINNIEQDLTFQTLKQISPFKIDVHNAFPEHEIENVASGWVLMSKRHILGSEERSYEGHKRRIEVQQDFFMPRLFEAVIFYVFGNNAGGYGIHCVETFERLRNSSGTVRSEGHIFINTLEKGFVRGNLAAFPVKRFLNFDDSQISIL